MVGILYRFLLWVKRPYFQVLFSFVSGRGFRIPYTGHGKNCPWIPKTTKRSGHGSPLGSHLRRNNRSHGGGCQQGFLGGGGILGRCGKKSTPPENWTKLRGLGAFWKALKRLQSYSHFVGFMLNFWGVDEIPNWVAEISFHYSSLFHREFP